MTPHTKEVMEGLELGGEFVDYEGDFRPRAREKLIKKLTTLESRIREEMEELIKNEYIYAGKEKATSGEFGEVNKTLDHILQSLKDKYKV